uniref:Snakin-2-like n=1 Tax=Nicotiana sylvestris TaxID=4096 RepID=A0A1U7VVH8_NICSY|nr:PREDICTED: snakin-2-like [Nicotiana sylvestris]
MDISKSKALIVSLIFLLFLLSAAENHELSSSNNIDAISKALKARPNYTINCGKECTRRCKLASRQKMCMRACGTCCARCNCVPPGTSGNENICPCYSTMTTHGNRRKCP